MEFSWARGTPRRLAQFRDRFPVIFEDSEAIREIAYEEYRLRLACGERPAVSEYESRFQLDCTEWPGLEDVAESRLYDRPDGSELPVDGQIDKSGDESRGPEADMRDAALAYTVFRLNSGNSPAERSEKDWSESVLSASMAGELFRELHESNPKVLAG